MSGMLEATIKRSHGALAINLTLYVPPGPLVLAGPSGAGKSTVLQMLLGALRPDEGAVRLGETALFDSASGVEVPTESRRIGYLPQHYGLFPHLSALENVRFAISAPKEEGRTIALRWLRELEVEGLGERRVDQLSGGERQRVALARALASNPRALLLDEPLAALDVTTRRSVRAFLAQRLRALRIPALVVTHDPDDAAALEAPVAILEAGRITQQGTMLELAKTPATGFVRDFAARH